MITLYIVGGGAERWFVQEVKRWPTWSRQPWNMSRETAVTKLARRLLRAVMTNEYPVGSRLPSERVLAEHYSVHRVTARSACQRLTADGVLAVKQGSGYWVQDYRVTGGPRLISEVLELEKDPTTLRLFLSDVLGMRLTLMGFAIRRLIDRLTPDDISRLRHKVSTFIDAVSSGVKPPELADLENQIIAEVLASTHSTVIQLSLNPLSRSYMGIRKFQDVIYRDPQQNALGYTLFLRWLDQPDPNLVATILEILEKRDEVTIDLVVEHVRATNRESD